MTVRTGNLHNADTEDAVRFAVQGDEAGAPSFRVERDFRTGETITFSPKRWQSLGSVRTVTVQKSAQENDAWYLEYVQVHDEALGKTYVCPVNAWILARDSTQHRYDCA